MNAWLSSFLGGIELRVDPLVPPGSMYRFNARGGERFVFHSKRECDAWLIRIGVLVKVKKGRGQRRNRRNR